MFIVIFFFKQKTAYGMRISDWSSDVCSSDLIQRALLQAAAPPRKPGFMGWGAGVWTPAFAGERAPVPRVSARTRFAIPAVCLCRDRERLAFAGQLLGARPGPGELAPIGRASGRERVCQSVSIQAVAVLLKQKN